MNSRTSPSYSQQSNRAKGLVALSGMLAILLIGNGAVGLFGLRYANEKHLSDLETLGQIAKAMETARAAQVHLKKQVQEWKDILLRGSNPEDFAQHRTRFDQEEKLMDQELTTLTGVVQNFGGTNDIEILRKTHNDLGTQYRNALTLYHPDDLASAFAVDRKVRGIDRQPTDQMDAIVAQFENRATELSRTVTEQTRSRYAVMRRISIGGTGAGVLIVLLFLWRSMASAPRD